MSCQDKAMADQFKDCSFGVTGLRWQLPQRMHDQEKLYSPALRSIFGGYSFLKAEQESMERERIERERILDCKEHERKYNELIKLFTNQSPIIEQGDSIEGFNEIIRDLNNYYGGKGCPSLPEIETPTFATKR